MIEIWLQEGDGKAKKVVVGGIESLVSSGGLMRTAIGWTGPITTVPLCSTTLGCQVGQSIGSG